LREKEQSKHSPGIQVKKRANLDLSTAPTRSRYAWRYACANRPEGAAVLAYHLQLVHTRSIIKEVRSLSVPEQHLPLKTGFSATSSSTTRAALRWFFPSSSRLSVSPVPPSSHRLCLWLISQRVASAVCSKRTDQQLIAILDGRPIQICFGPVEMLLCC
jgi:hypothetical protein